MRAGTLLVWSALVGCGGGRAPVASTPNYIALGDAVLIAARGVERDKARRRQRLQEAAASLYGIACDALDPEACSKLLKVPEFSALEKRSGAGYAGVVRRAVEGWRRGCDAGDANACFSLGTRAGGHAPLWLQPTALAEALRRACALGHVEGCARAAKIYFAPGPLQDVDWVTRLDAAACDSDHAAWCREAVARRKIVAVFESAQRECDRSDASACERVGRLRSSGRGVRVSTPLASVAFARAIRLRREACDSADAGACDGLLSQRKRQGPHSLLGLPPLDPKRAAELRTRILDLRTKGCAADDPEQCFELGYWHVRSQVPLDAPTVSLPYRKAALLYLSQCTTEADAKACIRIGEFTVQGIGVRPHFGRAEHLFERACALGLEAGCTRLAQHRRDGCLDGRYPDCPTHLDAGGSP